MTCAVIYRPVSAILAVILLVCATRGADNAPFYPTLAGPLPRVLKAAQGPYLVVEDIEVPLGKTVNIEPGAVLLFKNFTGLHVIGRLEAPGAQHTPVIFTSEYDRDYNKQTSMFPNPYDWNGIYIHKNAIGTNMTHCAVRYSVYGIVSETKFIRVNPGYFLLNGKTNLVIEGNEHIVTEKPYTYALTLKDATVDGVPVKILRDPMARKRTTLRYAAIIGAVGGCGLAIASAIQWRNASLHLGNLSAVDVDNLADNSSAVWARACRTRNKYRSSTLIASGVLVMSLTGFSWSFTF
jgi:hypothetical protein